MQSINKIPLSNGKFLYLDPRYQAKESETCYLFYGLQGDTVLVSRNLDSTISEKSAESLCTRKVASFEKSKIFSDPKLCQAIFNWSPNLEIDYLLRTIMQHSSKSVLDVGCGYGRLLVPLFQKGVNILGIDESLPLINALNENLDLTELHRGFYADMANFAIPNYFDLAFSAMNTLRYLEDIARIKRHFLILATSLMKGGLYLINVMLSSSPNENYCHKWQFDHQGKLKNCEWKYESYCHLTNKIIDKITIQENNVEENILLQEYQAQAHISVDIFRNILKDISEYWSFQKVVNANWQECDLDANLYGNYWITLKRN